MDKDIATEGKRAGRYTIVRFASRGADATTFAGLLWWWGIEWFAPAFAISSCLNWCIDFWGQKLWAFQNMDRRVLELLREFALYAVLRSLNIAGALSVWWLLQNILSFRWWTAAMITVPVFWATWFILARLLFYGNLKDLWPLLRKLWPAQ